LQLIKSATSIGANFRAARRARSHAEFTAKIGLVAEEVDESEYWWSVICELSLGDSEVQGAASRVDRADEDLRKVGRNRPESSTMITKWRLA
jgi:four helix bundle protein